MPRRLLVTCVSPERPHPSGRLAARQALAGVDVCTLFENARSLAGLLKDAKRLLAIVQASTYDEVQINVNGSIAQALAVVICRLYGINTTLWIMDSYPGCLRYVTRYWRLFYPIFFVGSVIAKFFAHHVLIIDEAFATHAPTWEGFRHKCVYTPLPQETISTEVVLTEQLPTLGILGNIEASWLVKDFQNLHAQARVHGYRVLVATSHAVDISYFSAEGVTAVIPWPKSETERVFSQCSAILVPLSEARLIYSSPSKIIDCYLRGIQPVVMTDKHAWEANRDRAIYRMCVHISEFFGQHKQHSSQQLKSYAQAWLVPHVGAGSLVGMHENLASCRDVTEQDLNSVTAIHMAAFPGFFLTSLGPAFVRTMYKAFWLNPQGIFVVNETLGRVEGFAVGAMPSEHKDRHLAMKMLPQFIGAVIPAVIRNPFKVLRRVASQFFEGDGSPRLPAGVAMLRSIGVAPALRGRGVAGDLLTAFEQRAQASGASSVALTTDVLDNDRAIQFYRKHGYEIAHEFKQDKRRAMFLMLKELR